MFSQKRFTSTSLSPRLPKHRSPLVFLFIILIHGVLIIFLLNQSLHSHKQPPQKVFQLIKLFPERKDRALEPHVPELPEVHPVMLIQAPILFFESKDSPSISPAYEPSDVSSGQYSGVFDPKMRQKLMDSQALNRPRTQEKSKTWTAIDDRTYIEMGDGVCMVSMAKTDSRDRATTWGFTRCGKNDSEKAMDRVMADYESRKAPLGKLKSTP